jgi:hypothetical protein
MSANDSNEVNSRVVPQGQLIEMLELYEGKLSRTVLRGKGASRLLPYPVLK